MRFSIFRECKRIPTPLERVTHLKGENIMARKATKPVVSIKEDALKSYIETATEANAEVTENDEIEMAEVNAMKAEIAALKAQLEATAKAPRTAKPKSSELKSKLLAEKEALSSHLSDAEIAAIQASDKNNLFAFLANEMQVPQVKNGRKTTTIIKPHSEWKPAAHFAATDALEVVALWNEGHGLKPVEIAKRMGCSPTYVGRILSGQQWSKVTGIVFTKWCIR
jgi:chromosome segregation ATPase